MVALVAAAGICSGCVGARAPWDTLARDASAPSVFFPGEVSRSDTEQWAFTFTPDGRQLYYATDEPRRIVTQTWRGGRWTPPEPLADPLADGDGGPFVTADGDYLYFSSWRDGSSSNLFRRSLNPPRDPERVTLTDGYSEQSVSLTVAGTGFLWTNGRVDNTPGIGFYTVRVVGGRLLITGDASNLHTGDSSGENTPFVDPSGRFVIFANYGITPGTREDLFISEIRGGRPGTPVSLGAAVNSLFNETAPYVTPDGAFLLFASDRPIVPGGDAGDYNIWWLPVAAIPALEQIIQR